MSHNAISVYFCTFHGFIFHLTESQCFNLCLLLSTSNGFYDLSFCSSGCLGTAGMLMYGLRAFHQGKTRQSQLLMRGRIFAQGFTITAIIAGVFVTAYKSKQWSPVRLTSLPFDLESDQICSGTGLPEELTYNVFCFQHHLNTWLFEKLELLMGVQVFCCIKQQSTVDSNELELPLKVL